MAYANLTKLTQNATNATPPNKTKIFFETLGLGRMNFHSSALDALIAHTPKQFLWVEGADHVGLAEVAGDRYIQAIQVFAQAIGYPTNV
jgi:hypothetical protein